MSDVRVPIGVAVSAFGLAVTVTPPGAAAVETTGIWEPPVRRNASDEVYEFGNELQRRYPDRKVLAVPLDATLTELPLGTAIEAPEDEGGPVLTWVVEGHERIESDHVRVIVVPV